jgi:hypothetical protein
MNLKEMVRKNVEIIYLPHDGNHFTGFNDFICRTAGISLLDLLTSVKMFGTVSSVRIFFLVWQVLDAAQFFCALYLSMFSFLFLEIHFWEWI